MPTSHGTTQNEQHRIVFDGRALLRPYTPKRSEEGKERSCVTISGLSMSMGPTHIEKNEYTLYEGGCKNVQYFYKKKIYNSNLENFLFFFLKKIIVFY